MRSVTACSTAVTGAIKGLGTLLGVAGLLTLNAGVAHAAFGDNYDILPINSGPGTVDVPAVPGASKFFWAGACSRASAPSAGTDLGPMGGIGAMPANATAPRFGTPVITEVPLLGTVRDCIDWRLGANIAVTPLNMWSPPPNWRLPAAAQAGAHPDGSATFAVRAEDGDTDNFVVDLPAGFVGDPNAVPKCTAEQFANVPPQCHPMTQVGVITIRIQAAASGNMTQGFGGQRVDTLPVFNIEPRRGNVAELGVAQVSGEGKITVRIVAKARTNGDFGVRTFVAQIPAAALPVHAQTITLWGVPWAASNDAWRAAPRIWRIPTDVRPDECSLLPETGVATAHVIPPGGLSAGSAGPPATPNCRESWQPSWGPIRPFLSNPTECSGRELSTLLATDAYQRPGSFVADGGSSDDGLVTPRNGDPDLSDPNWKTATSPAPPVVGCQKPPFEPAASLTPTSTAADSPSGLSVDITIPQNRDLAFDPPEPSADQGEVQGEVDAYVAAAADHWNSDAGLATSQLDKTVVTLPEGMSVNPASATGLTACPDSVVGITAPGNPPTFNNVDPFDGQGVECPDGSKIGTVVVETPLLEEPLTGEMILGEPHSTDPQSGEMFRLFVVVRDKDRGLVAKIYGSSVADPTTGRLTTTFDNNPRVPFEKLHLDVKGGSRGLLAMPQSCGDRATESIFSPWSAEHDAGGVSRTVLSGFTVDGDCSRRFAPTLDAGMNARQGGGSGVFSFHLARTDGEQWMRDLTATLPTGLLASVRDVPLCTSAQAAAGACPEASRIGTADAGAGSGNQFFLEEKGEVFLTEGYKGCPYGLAVKVRAIAGPFRGARELTPIVVRQAVCVDRSSAQVTAISDPFPTIWHGIPLRVREVLVKVDRARFMRNPTDCSPKQIRANLGSADGATASLAVPFQTTGCGSLRFHPKLAMQLTGRKQTKTGKHPGVRARVTQRAGEAGIRKAVVRLPKSLALDPANAQALCEFEDGTKPDLENHCPKGSIVGRARGVSPLLKRPLSGDVYFVKNVKRSSTGNLIRTLPMIIVALRGEIAINLKGTSSVSKSNRLVNTFAGVPDAPVSRFNLGIRGGKNGILAVTRTRRARIDICRGKHIAQADMDGQNGRRRDFDVKLKTPRCAKKSATRGKAKNRGR